MEQYSKVFDILQWIITSSEACLGQHLGHIVNNGQKSTVLRASVKPLDKSILHWLPFLYQIMLIFWQKGNCQKCEVSSLTKNAIASFWQFCRGIFKWEAQRHVNNDLLFALFLIGKKISPHRAFPCIYIDWEKRLAYHSPSACPFVSWEGSAQSGHPSL